MSVLTIRSLRRYAMRMPVALRRAGAKPAKGLLIELSQHGARISNLGRRKFEEGQDVTIALAGDLELSGKIRWAHDGLAGIKLHQSLHAPEMSALLDSNKERTKPVEPRYGT